MFDETKAYLKRLGLPEGDLHELPSSEKRFPDGGNFRVEVATVNTLEAAEIILQFCQQGKTWINEITHTSGITLMLDEEIKDFVKLAQEYGIELRMGVGPRATNDIGAQVKVNSVPAHAVGARLRGMDQLIRAIEDVKRAVALGCRGILVMDEGLLYILNQMRKDGTLPADLKFKASAALGACNPVGCKVIENLGADSINLQRDLPLSMIAAIRAYVDVPLDIHSDNPVMSGGFMRFYEAPEFVRIAAPVYIKAGNSALPEHDMYPSKEQARRMAQRVVRVTQMIKEYYPEAVQSGVLSKVG